MYDLIIKGTAIYEKDGKLVTGNIVIGVTNGIIKAVSTEKLEGEKIIQLSGNELLIPAFYGTHTHGGGNLTAPALGKYNTASGRFEFDKSQIKENIEETLKAHFKSGTAALNISSMACPLPQLEAFLKATADFGSTPGMASYIYADFESIYFAPNNPDGRIKDIPAISNPNLGAQSKEFLVKPSSEHFKRLQDIAQGRIGRVCVGMDWDGVDDEKPAKKLVKYLAEQGTVIGLGHTNANISLLKEAIMPEGKYVWVHATNGHATATGKKGMLNILNGVGELVDDAANMDAGFYAEIITDDKHVDPKAALWVRSIFGPEKIIIIDDNIGHTGSSLPEGVGTVVFGGTEAVLSKDGQVFVVNDGTGTTFCGSNATMWRCAENYTNMLMGVEEDGRGPIPAFRSPGERHKPLNMEEALVEVSMAASTNPARLYGQKDRGSITPGKVADLLIIEKVKTDFPVKLKLKRIIQGGREL